MKVPVILVLTALMISAFAAAVEKTDGFVCPVFNKDSEAGEKNPNAVQIADNDFTIIGPEVSVPVHATNGNGAGSPAGEHSSPQDSDYTAIWSG
ncbi:hypothetical protein GOV09_06300 [Candidatus Woesearchaeota archaeon]|nr:hypothetical protein [Candidatus Woesearchaeota archaeon]